MISELSLMAEFFGVEYRHIQKKFPLNTLPIMRLLRKVKLERPDKLELATDRLYEATFVRGVLPDDIVAMSQALAQPPEVFSSTEQKALISSSESPENKEATKRDANRLVSESGAFGFPWIEVCQPESDRTVKIFGSDRFEFLAHWLGQPWMGPNPPQSGWRTKL